MFLVEFTVIFRPELVVLDEATFEFEERPKLGFFRAPGTSRIARVHPQRLPEVLRVYNPSERTTWAEGRKLPQRLLGVFHWHYRVRRVAETNPQR